MNHLAKVVCLGMIMCAMTASPALAQDGAAPPPGREFEFAARRHYFAGVLHGDKESFEQGKELVRERLEQDPNDPEALQWHGSYTATEGIWAYRAGDEQRGRILWREGLEIMDRSVALAPLQIGQRIGRGSMLLSVGLDSFPFDDEQFRRRVIETGLADMELARALGESMRDQFTEHGRGQMLLLLARGNAEVGNPDRARRFAEQCVAEVPEGRPAVQAQALLAKLDAGEFQRGGDQPPQEAAPMEVLFAQVMTEMDRQGLLAPDGVAARVARFAAELDADDGAPDRALTSLRDFAEEHGGEALAWYGAAAVIRAGRLFETGQWQTAVPIWERGKEALVRGVEKSGGAVGARFARGWIYAMVARYEQEQNAASADKMRTHASDDLSLVIKAMRPAGAPDALAALLAGLASVEEERGNADQADRYRVEAQQTAQSERLHELIVRMFDR